MADGVSSPQNHFLLDGSYDHFYFLPNDRHGELLLRLLYNPAARNSLDAILSENLLPGVPGWNLEHDAVDQDGDPVLFAYLCDMPRLRRFDTALNLQERSGTVLCFDFQEEALRQVCGVHAMFQTIDFEKVISLLMPQT